MSTTLSDTSTEHVHDRKESKPASIVGVFPSRKVAREAIAELHKNHFTHSWFGVVSEAVAVGGRPVVTIEQPGFFSLKSQHIVDALVKHGVPAPTATALEPALSDGQAIVTVEPKSDEPGKAEAILRSAGGQSPDSVISSASRDRVRGSTLGGLDLAGDGNDQYGEEIFYFVTLE